MRSPNLYMPMESRVFSSSSNTKANIHIYFVTCRLLFSIRPLNDTCENHRHVRVHKRVSQCCYTGRVKQNTCMTLWREGVVGYESLLETDVTRPIYSMYGNRLQFGGTLNIHWPILDRQTLWFSGDKRKITYSQLRWRQQLTMRLGVPVFKHRAL